VPLSSGAGGGARAADRSPRARGDGPSEAMACST
jgi:hypothetical protein